MSSSHIIWLIHLLPVILKITYGIPAIIPSCFLVYELRNWRFNLDVSFNAKTKTRLSLIVCYLCFQVRIDLVWMLFIVYIFTILVCQSSRWTNPDTKMVKVVTLTKYWKTVICLMKWLNYVSDMIYFSKVPQICLGLCGFAMLYMVIIDIEMSFSSLHSLVVDCRCSNE